jgi:hypothetical protein
MQHRFALILLFFACCAAPARAFSDPKQPATGEKIVTGTVLLQEKAMPDPQRLLAALRSEWKMRTDSANTGERTLIFSTPGATVMVAYLDYPVAPAEVQAAANISWTWKTAATEVARHQAQVVVSVVGSSGKTLELYKIFTQTAAALLDVCPSANGVFLNSQYMLSSKEFFAAAARNMQKGESLPIYCWVYFGMLQQDGLSSGYTFGMQEFGMLDMEIAQSKHSVQEVHAALYDAALLVIQYNLQLADGQTVTTAEDAKIPVRKSPGAMLEGEVLRLDY